MQCRTRNVLIAVNDSEHSKRAFDWYLEKVHMAGDQVLLAHVVDGAQIPAPTLARYLEKVHMAGDQVLLAHVVDGAQIPAPTLAHGPSHSREEWDDMMCRLQAEALKVTSKYEETCKAVELPHKTLSAVGCVGEAICEIGKNEHVDLVIIGNRGLGTIRRTILGSVSDYIIQHSDIPVLVVPPNKSD